MKTSGSAITSSILCPDANGNTSPTITYVMAVNNLPADYKFNSIGIDIHALNGAGAYQESSDRWTGYGMSTSKPEQAKRHCQPLHRHRILTSQPESILMAHAIKYGILQHPMKWPRLRRI